MGVHGLWKLLDAAGKPVPVETLENKVLAVDVSIWLHQAARGFQDARGQALPNAHLLGLFHRLCKLLFWRVRPVFVFDGGAPLLKQQTVAARRRRREDAQERADRARRRLVELHLRKYAVQAALKERALREAGGEGGDAVRPLALPPLLLPPSSQHPADDLFTLPPVPQRSRSPGSRSGDEDEPWSDDDNDDAMSVASASTAATAGTSLTVRRAAGRVRTRGGAEFDLHTVDVRSADFLALPADVRHEILTELKETRKQNSWGRLHEMPRESGDFSSYQMKRLLQRRSVQESLEATEKEMGGRSMSLAELEELMKETGALAAAAPGKRIAADASARYILLTGGGGDGAGGSAVGSQDITNEDEVSDEIPLLTSEQESTSTNDVLPIVKPNDTINEFFEEYSDEEVTDWFPELDYGKSKDESDDLVTKQLKTAHNFIFENSGLTQEQILAVIKDHSSSNKINPLDQPSTSKPCCSKSLYIPSSNSENNIFEEKDDIIRAHSSSVVDLPSISKGIMQDQENEFDHISIKAKNDSSNKSLNRILETPKFVSDLKENKPAGDIVQNVSTSEKEEKSKMKKEISLNHMSSNKLTKEKMLSSERISQRSCTIECKLGDFSVLQKKESFEKVVERFPDNVPQDTSHSSPSLNVSSQLKKNSLEEKDSCSSEEDLVEVVESTQTIVKLDVSQPFKAKTGPLEVVIQTSVTNLDEDIFADVFETRSEQTEKSHQSSTKSSEEINNTQAESTDSYSNTMVIQEKLAIVQKSSQKDDFIQAKTINVEFLDATCTISPVSNVDDEVMMSDSGSDAVEEVNEVPEDSLKESKEGCGIPTRETVKLTTQQLEDMQGSLQEEGNLLQKAQAREERIAASITEQMVQEAQELLQLFGVPYVVAPMEAEAQCAFLDRASLTDGTITDDSDIWLFGGQKVYKNFFDQKKHVLQFRDIDILHHFKLARTQLVLLALLVGSDYTTGLPGVGPVTALEILAAFPTRTKQGPPAELVEGLRRFREWFTSGSAERWEKTKLRNKLKDLELTGEFPSIPVVEAYLSPKVDESMEKFSWGSPDVESIKEFARIKFGWPTSKTHEILQPIMKKLNIKISQLTIETYFQPKPNLPPGGGELSKRVREAIDKIGASEDSGSDEDESPAKKPRIVRNVPAPKSSRITKYVGKVDEARARISEALGLGRGRGRGRGSNRRGNEVGAVSRSTPTHNPSDPSVGASTSRTRRREKVSIDLPDKAKEFILQREKDKLNLLKNKLKAIEVFRKSSRGLDTTKRDRKKKRTILSEAKLSESSNESSSDE